MCIWLKTYTIKWVSRSWTAVAFCRSLGHLNGFRAEEPWTPSMRQAGTVIVAVSQSVGCHHNHSRQDQPRLRPQRPLQKSNDEMNKTEYWSKWRSKIWSKKQKTHLLPPLWSSLHSIVDAANASGRNGYSHGWLRPNNQLEKYKKEDIGINRIIESENEKIKQQRLAFYSWCLIVQRRTAIVSVFWKNTCRAEIWGRFCGPFQTKLLKMVHFWGRSCKLGGNILPPSKFSASLPDSKLTVDYVFTIKHASIQSYDWVMDVCVIPKLRWAPKIMIIP